MPRTPPPEDHDHPRPPSASTRRWLTTEQAARHLGYGNGASVRALVPFGLVKPDGRHDPGGRWMFTVERLEACLRGCAGLPPGAAADDDAHSPRSDSPEVRAAPPPEPTIPRKSIATITEQRGDPTVGPGLRDEQVRGRRERRTLRAPELVELIEPPGCRPLSGRRLRHQPDWLEAKTCLGAKTRRGAGMQPCALHRPTFPRAEAEQAALSRKLLSTPGFRLPVARTRPHGPKQGARPGDPIPARLVEAGAGHQQRARAHQHQKAMPAFEAPRSARSRALGDGSRLDDSLRGQTPNVRFRGEGP